MLSALVLGTVAPEHQVLFLIAVNREVQWESN